MGPDGPENRATCPPTLCSLILSRAQPHRRLSHLYLSSCVPAIGAQPEAVLGRNSGTGLYGGLRSVVTLLIQLGDKKGSIPKASTSDQLKDKYEANPL